MNVEFIDRIKGAAVVPIALSIVMIPFSLLIGWNLITMVVFWLVITPALSYFLPGLVSGNKSRLLKSLSGLLIFYCIMVLMIYDHSKSDYFRVMALSGLINLATVSLIFRACTRTPVMMKNTTRPD